RQVQPVAAYHTQDIVDDRPNRDLPYRPAVVARTEGLNVPPERRPVDGAARDTELVERINVAVRVLAHHRQQRPDQLLLDTVSDVADHAEVNDGDPLAG